MVCYLKSWTYKGGGLWLLSLYIILYFSHGGIIWLTGGMTFLQTPRLLAPASPIHLPIDSLTGCHSDQDDAHYHMKKVIAAPEAEPIVAQTHVLPYKYVGQSHDPRDLVLVWPTSGRKNKPYITTWPAGWFLLRSSPGARPGAMKVKELRLRRVTLRVDLYRCLWYI